MKRLTHKKYDTLDYFIKESIFWKRRYANLPSTFNKCGWGNGYIVIPKNHPFYKMHYNEIHEKYDIDVHGGFTFAGEAKEMSWPEVKDHMKKNDLWILGFDTNHAWDTEEKWPKREILKHTREIANKLNKIK